MQLLQPKVKELQKKYGHDRERLAQETMALYKETGTNPFASCLPILLQMPIFLALFRLIDHAAKHPDQSRALMTTTLAHQFANATFLGAKISDSFTSTHELSVRILAGVLVVAMTATTFLTQRQLMSKNMPRGRDERAVRPAAEDAALRAPPGLRGRRYRLPDRRARSTGPPRTCGRCASSST